MYGMFVTKEMGMKTVVVNAYLKRRRPVQSYRMFDSRVPCRRHFTMGRLKGLLGNIMIMLRCCERLESEERYVVVEAGLNARLPSLSIGKNSQAAIFTRA